MVYSKGSIRETVFPQSESLSDTKEGRRFYGMDSNLFVSKYELYLPDRKELEKLVNRILEDDNKDEVIM